MNSSLLEIVFFRNVIHLQDFCMMYFLETPVLFCFYDILCRLQYFLYPKASEHIYGPDQFGRTYNWIFFYYFGLNLWKFALNLYFFLFNERLETKSRLKKIMGEVSSLDPGPIEWGFVGCTIRLKVVVLNRLYTTSNQATNPSMNWLFLLFICLFLFSSLIYSVLLQNCMNL